MIVRSIERADVGPVVDLARKMHEESPHYRDYPFRAEKLVGWCKLCLESPDWICWVAIEGDEYVGMLAVGAVEMIFSEQKTVDDLAFYVVPEKRGTSIAPRLLSVMRQWAELHGAAEIRMGVTTEIDNDRVSKYLERKGFTQTGTLMTQKI